MDTTWVANWPQSQRALSWSELLSIAALVISGLTFWWTTLRPAHPICADCRDFTLWHLPDGQTAFSMNLLVVNQGSITSHITGFTLVRSPKDIVYYSPMEGNVEDLKIQDSISEEFHNDVMVRLYQNRLESFSIRPNEAKEKRLIFFNPYINSLDKERFTLTLYAQQVSSGLFRSSRVKLRTFTLSLTQNIVTNDWDMRRGPCNQKVLNFPPLPEELL